MSAKKTDRDLDLQAVVDTNVDSLLPFGAELLAFADAAASRDIDAMSLARQALFKVVGEPGAVRAAAVVGNFQMMNRLLDAIGVRVSRAGMKLAAELGLEIPAHLQP